MKITGLKIHNWRSIKDIEISVESLMVFIGQNNHGKSNVLSSLLFFFGTITCTDLDFCKGEDEVYVEVTFGNLDEHDKRQFGKYVTSDETIKVRKSISRDGSPEYHGYCQSPVDEWLKEESASAYTTRDAINATPLAELVPPSGKLTKDIIKEAQQAYITANSESVEFNYILETSNFMGAKTVAQGMFGDVYFIPAVKNASDEFSAKGKSVFNQLLTSVINDMSSANAAYREAKERIRTITGILNKRVAGGAANESRPEQITQLERLLEGELSSWNTIIDIEITPPDIDEVLKVGTNVWIDDGIATDVNRKGHGLQRALIFALIKSWSKLLQQQREAAAVGDENSGRRASKSTYFIFEEPELYLHPHAQRELFSSLKGLSETDNQVFLSTHSSSFIDLDLHKSICIVYKANSTEGSKHLQCDTDMFASMDDKKRFNMTYWINPDRGELFFAKKIILVEGATDKTVIPLLAKKLNVFRFDYTVIDCGSKDNIPMYLNLLNKFKLNYVAVYDLDHQTGKDASAITAADNSSSLIASAVVPALGKAVILNNDIEEEIGLIASGRNKPYLALQHISASGYSISSSLQTKIQDIYAD